MVKKRAGQTPHRLLRIEKKKEPSDRINRIDRMFSALRKRAEKFSAAPRQAKTRVCTGRRRILQLTRPGGAEKQNPVDPVNPVGLSFSVSMSFF
jgi:hypothetical protein